MFKFGIFDVSNFETKNVKDMSGMSRYCQKLKILM